MFPVDLIITRTNKHTPNVWSFFMVPQDENKFEFKAGQVAVLGMDGYISSYVAFASAPEEPEMEFLIKRGDPAKFAGAVFDPHIAKRVIMHKIVGTGFPVENFQDHDLVMVAMGTGLAPLRSTLRHVFSQRDRYGRLIVLYGARMAVDFCYENEMETLWRQHGVELRQVLSRPGNTDWSGPTGYVQSLLDNIVPDLRRPVALVCGSQEMIEQTRARLLELGFEGDKILTNY